MNNGDPWKPSIGARMTNELREFAVIAAYLCICFTALAYLKAAILRAHGIDFAPFGFAVIKALICAKFVLVGRVFNLEGRFKASPLIWQTLYKSLAFFVLLFVLNVFEEVIVGLIHGRTVADSIAEIGGGTLDQLIATSIIVFLIFIPFFAFRSLGEVVGERNLVRMFFAPRHEVDLSE
jgi:hypothetical protein